MSQKSPKYRLNPSLLSKFQDLLDSDMNWEQFYGGQEEPPITAEEYYNKCENELLNACNRVPFTSEATSRGTALNEIVDCMIETRVPKDGIRVSRLIANGDDRLLYGLRAELDGFSFDFDFSLCKQLFRYFNGSICQNRCEAVMETSFGPVILYGDADYIRRDVVYDLKTTSSYSYPKYDRGWQRHLYPWALLESGDVQYISGFEYTPVQLKGGNSKPTVITGEIYKEWYDFSFEDSKLRLKEISEAFIPWIEAHRNLIVHPRIFNKE